MASTQINAIQNVNYRCRIHYFVDDETGYQAARLQYRYVKRSWYGRLKSKWITATVMLVLNQDGIEDGGTLSKLQDERNQERILNIKERRIRKYLDDSNN